MVPKVWLWIDTAFEEHEEHVESAIFLGRDLLFCFILVLDFFP